MNKQEKTNTMMLSLAVAFGVILAAGFIAIPAIEEAQASDVGKAIRDKVHEHTDGLKDKIGGSGHEHGHGHGHG